jgi:hypothetical protein
MWVFSGRTSFQPKNKFQKLSFLVIHSAEVLKTLPYD